MGSGMRGILMGTQSQMDLHPVEITRVREKPP